MGRCCVHIGASLRPNRGFFASKSELSGPDCTQPYSASILNISGTATLKLSFSLSLDHFSRHFSALLPPHTHTRARARRVTYSLRLFSGSSCVFYLSGDNRRDRHLVLPHACLVPCGLCCSTLFCTGICDGVVSDIGKIRHELRRTLGQRHPGAQPGCRDRRVLPQHRRGYRDVDIGLTVL